MSKLGFKIIDGVVSKATASLIASENYIILFSYDTCVLEYDRKKDKVLSINPYSVTTTKAITQTKNYFGLEFDTKKENKRLNE